MPSSAPSTRDPASKGRRMPSSVGSLVRLLLSNRLLVCVLLFVGVAGFKSAQYFGGAAGAAKAHGMLEQHGHGGAARPASAEVSQLRATVAELEKRVASVKAWEEQEQTKIAAKQAADEVQEKALAEQLETIKSQVAQVGVIAKVASGEGAAAAAAGAAAAAAAAPAGAGSGGGAAEKKLLALLASVKVGLAELHAASAAVPAAAVAAAGGAAGGVAGGVLRGATAKALAAEAEAKSNAAAAAAAAKAAAAKAASASEALLASAGSSSASTATFGAAGAAAAASSGGGGFKGGPAQVERQAAVVTAMRWAWKGYVDYAWGKDELHPVSKHGEEWFGLGLTLIDALDTLWVMGLKEEFKAARDWVDQHLEAGFKKSQDVNLFETSIRVLGGLLSSYRLSGDAIFLTRATDLAQRLLPAFKTRSGIPFSDVNLGQGTAHAPQWGADSSLAEVTTVQLEFKEVARAAKRPDLAAPAQRTNDLVAKLTELNPLPPIFINADSGQLSGSTVTLGARGDSYYEYLLKQWLQTGRTERVYWDRYAAAMRAVLDKLLRQSSGPLKLTFVGELLGGSFSPKMDHLVCFLPGTLALAYHFHPDGQGCAEAKRFLGAAEKLTETCHHMYDTAVGLAPEIVFFHTEAGATEDIIIKPQDSHNLLRPEALEAIFLMHRVTGDPKYREWGWKIFQAFEKYTRVATGGYSSLERTIENPPRMKDKMETFFLGETLKYCYLLFSDDSVLPLDKWVINTEAHPLPVYIPGNK